MHDEPRFPDATLIDDCLLADRQAFRKRLTGLERRWKKKQPVDIGLEKLEKEILASLQTVALRRDLAREISFPPDLPITGRLDEIRETIAASQIVILCGETGSGKSTQLPKICLSLGLGIHGRIGHTQPRRIAARSLMSRISAELGSEPGALVGYKVRFKDHVRRQTRVKLMTDGILLAEIQRDAWLNEYDTLIIDEAHERSLNIDFLLGYVKQLIARRSDLKVIITSATIDPQRFSRHFDNAPVIEVSGRTFPVDLRYRPLEEEGVSERDEAMHQAIKDAVDELAREDRGDILVFLSGEREIRETAETLRKHSLQATEVLPLYARLAPADQAKIFNPSGKRRIVLATNVAETSLTVPRIRFVIDSGLARISRYGHRSRIQRLPIEAISQASANQRAGRCGRLGPGTCVRLFSAEDFAGRPEFTEPEILRTSLASVILRMLTMGLGAVEDFPFLDRPAPRMIKDAYQLLVELGAIDDSRAPTKLGRRLARWPMDVRLARMVEEGARQGCLEDLLVLAAALSIQDPRERPLEAQSAADEAHGRFADPKSDFAGLLKLWQYLRKQRRSVSGNQFRKLCRREFLNWQRVLEWFDLYQQLRDQAREDRLPLSGRKADDDRIHPCLLTGLLSHVGLKHPEDNSYSGVRNRSFYIFPGSGLFGSAPKWIMAAEIVETTRPYGRVNAVIRPEWIEAAAPHLLKRRHFDPHWSRRRGAVLVKVCATTQSPRGTVFCSFSFSDVPVNRLTGSGYDPITQTAELKVCPVRIEPKS